MPCAKLWPCWVLVIDGRATDILRVLVDELVNYPWNGSLISVSPGTSLAPMAFMILLRDYFVNGLSQWKTTLQCNIIISLAGRMKRIIPAYWNLFTREVNQTILLKPFEFLNFQCQFLSTHWSKWVTFSLQLFVLWLKSSLKFVQLTEKSSLLEVMFWLPAGNKPLQCPTPWALLSWAREIP